MHLVLEYTTRSIVIADKLIANERDDGSIQSAIAVRTRKSCTTSIYELATMMKKSTTPMHLCSTSSTTRSSP
ncbi:hypothetical protein OH492_11355 [Vibrio chagasii]|nr:hypothetical protein [Vibrio chagasii]